MAKASGLKVEAPQPKTVAIGEVPDFDTGPLDCFKQRTHCKEPVSIIHDLHVYAPNLVVTCCYPRLTTRDEE